MRATIRPHGSVGPVLTRWEHAEYTLIHSDVLLNELRDVLTRPRIADKYHISGEFVSILLRAILLRGELVDPQRRLTVCRDPKDDKVLEAAVAGNADVIVTGDEDLLVLSPFEGISIVTPAVFLAMLDQAREASPR